MMIRERVERCVFVQVANPGPALRRAGCSKEGQRRCIMPEQQTPDQISETILPEEAARQNEPLPTLEDPGGAHVKGFSADPSPDADVAKDPVPLAEPRSA